MKVSNQYIELGVEFAFNCLNWETTLQISEEAKAVLEGLESMTFEILSLSKDTLKMKIIDYGDTSFVVMVPAK